MLENMTKKVTLEKVIEAGTELKIWERSHQNSKGRIEKSKLSIDEKTDYLFLKGLYQKLLRSYKKQLESKVEANDTDSQKQFADMEAKNRILKQEYDNKMESLQRFQNKVLAVFGDRWNKWQNDPSKKWQYETVKKMSEEIGIKFSSRQQDN